VHFEERHTPPGLEGVVSRFWFLEMPRNQRFEKILPLPYVHVIINLSTPYAIWSRASHPTPVSHAFVSGLQSEYLVIESPPEIRHVGVELTPAGLHALAPAAAALSAGHVQDAVGILPGIADLISNLPRDATPTAALNALESYVRHARVNDPDQLVLGALNELARDPATPIGTIADTLGVSNRTLIARFRTVTGTTPKQHAQVLRFHRFVDSVQDAGATPDWASLAAESGYADQPHVIRAFRRFSGWTPTEYHRLASEYGTQAAHFVPLEQIPRSGQARP